MYSGREWTGRNVHGGGVSRHCARRTTGRATPSAPRQVHADRGPHSDRAFRRTVVRLLRPKQPVIHYAVLAVPFSRCLHGRRRRFRSAVGFFFSFFVFFFFVDGHPWPRPEMRVHGCLGRPRESHARPVSISSCSDALARLSHLGNPTLFSGKGRSSSPPPPLRASVNHNGHLRHSPSCRTHNVAIGMGACRLRHSLTRPPPGPAA